MSKLVIRADASTEIGTGHVMRCLALAQAWQDRGGSVTFACADLPSGLVDYLNQEKFELLWISEQSGSLQDAYQLLEMVNHSHVRWLVLDGYHFHFAYQEAVRAGDTKVLLLDDCGENDHYVADLILNQNISASHVACYSDYSENIPHLFGTQFVLLRREFWPFRNWRRPVTEAAKHILVTLGGADPDNATLAVLKALTQTSNDGLEVVVVIGASNPHHQALRDFVQQSSLSVRLLHNVTDMPTLMNWTDLAVSAGGSTCWELAFLGVPTLALVVADNQWSVVNTLTEQEGIRSAGAYAAVTTASLAQEIERLLHDLTLRRRLSRQGQQLIDGYGVERVLDAMHGKLTVRPAVWTDMERLWRWANDPDVRRNSFHPGPISLASHIEWYRKRLASNRVRIWVLEEMGVPVAQIRYEAVNANTAEIDFSVSVENRGRGLGTAALKLTSQLVCRELAVETLQGVVIQTNTASSRTFEKAGFVHHKDEIVAGYPCSIYVCHCQTVNADSKKLL